MNQLILHYFFMVCICSRKISGYSMEKSNHFDMDDFINLLLSSQKFDELADKVAEKAAKKIKNLETLEHVHVSEKSIARQSAEARHSVEAEEPNHENEKNNNNNEDRGERKKVINSDSKERNERNESPPLKQDNKNEYNKLKDVDHRERERDEKPSNKIVKSKINTQALMKKDDDSAPPELSLQFKQLVKHAQHEKVRNRPDSRPNEHNPWKHLEYSKPKRDPPMLVGKNQEINSVSSERNAKYTDSNENPRHQDRREKIISREYNKPRSRPDYPPRNSRPQFKAEKIPPTVVDINENEEPKDTEEMKEEVLEPQRSIKNEADQQERMPRRDEDADFTMKAHNSEYEKSEYERSGSNEQFAEYSTPGYELGELTTIRRAIRREGGRVYAYLSAPEYEEFHKKLEKQRKKKGIPAI